MMRLKDGMILYHGSYTKVPTTCVISGKIAVQTTALQVTALQIYKLT